MPVVSFVEGLGIGIEQVRKVLVGWFYCFISPDRVLNPVRACCFNFFFRFDSNQQVKMVGY
jgi:hypothetical protein